MKEQITIPGFLADVYRQCTANTSNIAVIDDDGRKTTYGEFLELARRTCGYIKAQGIPGGSFIVINLPGRMEYLAVELGVWMAGCAIVPVNPTYPPARIDYIRNHCESPLTVDEDAIAGILSTEPSDIFNPTADIAAIYYTSGSTGNPKGVMHTFETLGCIDGFREVSDVGSSDIFAFGAPMSFIAGNLCFMLLRAGAAIRLIGRDTMTDIRKLQDFYDNSSVTMALISPSVLRQLDLGKAGKLRLVTTGTERVSGIGPGASYELLNLYGMTETGGPTCYYKITEPMANTPVGKFCSRIELKLDDDGEICLRGPLTPGYYKDAEGSAELWRGGWLHTGDIGRMLPDGNLEYINRKDWMVKINGQRVETGEITQVLRSMPGMKDAAVKGFTSPDGRQYLVAYCVSGEDISSDAVRDFISKKLAPYMIPSHFVRMQALPVNMNGKVDIKSLQSPAEVNVERKGDITLPVTPEQTALCKAFEQALGISPIGIDDDFFLLGGDSIRVMQVQVACPDMDLSSSMIYRLRTVRAICDELENAATAASPVTSGTKHPLSQTQTGIFVESMAQRGSTSYNNPFLYEFTDPIDAQRLAKACTAALKAHPGLFATLGLDDDGAPFQKSGSTDDFEVRVEKLTDKEFGALRSGLVRPFDLLTERLFRISIFKTESAVRLFCDFHHIVFDGTSNAILLSDIEKAYSGSSVSAEDFTGFDLTEEEKLKMSSSFYEECRKWNLDSFREADHTSLPDPDRFSDAVSFDKFETPTGISVHAFAKAAQRLGVTENVLATAAFGYMLGSCTHSMGSAFATIYNGRKSLKTRRTVSMLVKTLPVLCKWDRSTLVGDLLKATADQLMGAMVHDLFCFADICHDTAFDSRVLFSYQDDLLERVSLCGSACRASSLLENATGEPFTVQLYKDGGALTIRTEYRSNMFSREYISAFIDCFRTILSGLLLADKDSPASSIPLIDEVRMSSMISTGKGPALNYDRNLTAVGMFRRQLASRPDAVACKDEQGSLTYRELDVLSDILAGTLISRGVVKEDFAALMLPRLNLFPISFMACFKSGAAYVPMDYEYPVDRLQYMMEDCGAKVLLTTHAIYEQKKAEGLTGAPAVIFVDDTVREQTAGKDGGKATGMDLSSPGGLAYMIYTSGTTGKPKGVMIEHHSLTNLVHWYAETCGIAPGSNVAEHASFSFDGSVTELMTPLCFGATLHIIPADMRKDLAAMYRWFCENRIDSTLLTTQLGTAMLRMYDLKLKCLVVGGEKLSGKFNTSVRLLNGYGPTEFTVASSYYPVDTRNIPDNIPIGKAVPNTVSAIIDPCGRLLPRGIAGELVLIGEQLSRGYWHRPDITAERFTSCSFIPGEKMYHTGDLAKWNDKGELLYLGRIDTQVKLRGFRIELGEIESNISKFPGITAAVVAVKEIAGLQHLCAYYVAGSAIDKEALRQHLASSLTDYMVPTAYMQMESLPMTPNGKVDMRSLPLPEIKAEEKVAPATQLESTLLGIAADYMGNDNLGVTTNLISMGLTSLGAITLSLLIERKASMDLPSPKILERPTIREWAQYLEKSGEGKGAPAEEDADAYPTLDHYPLTDNQTGIYIDWEQHRDSTQYNVPMLFRFKGIEAEKVASAARSFIEAHPYLKTHLDTIDGQVVQLRNEGPAHEIPVTELGKEPDKAYFQNLLEPFDLFKGPLFRFKVFKWEDSVWLLSDVHHIVFDGGSEAIFAKELTELCNGGSVTQEKFSAFDYSLCYRDWKESEEFGKAQRYFETLLDGTVAATVPTTLPAQGSGSATIELSVDRKGIRELSRKAGITENALFLAATTEVLHRFCREKSIAILTVSNGRADRRLERSCGMFVQTLPVVSHEAPRTVQESLKMMHSQIVQTLSNDKFPYTKIVETTGLKAGILLAYQGDVLGGPIKVAGNDVQLTGLSLDTAKFPLSINVVPDATQTRMGFEYDRALFSETDIRNYAEAVKSFIENMIEQGCEASVGGIACVSPSESGTIISLGKGPDLEVAPGTIVGLVGKCAAAHPDDPAVSDGKDTISYACLDKASDLLAGVLIRAGLRKEEFVTLMMPRSKEYVIAYMAVFKSGAAYVPMDYEYPIERLQYMVDDSRSGFLVTTHDIFDRKSAEGEIKVGNIVFIDDIDFSAASEAAPVDLSTSGGLAYMIYTSGTTGKPKGVMIEHRALMNMIHWNRDLAKVERGTHVAQHPSFSFDASIMDLMTTIAFGGELFIIPEALRKDPELLYKFLCDNSIEAMVASTQLGMMLMNSYKLPIRYIMLGGEKLTGKYDRAITVVNGYGPTEFTVCSSYHILDPDSKEDNIPIGRAVPNTVSAVVDPCGQLLPEGVPGELVLIGPQIARGYWNKEDITAKRFVSCPFIPGGKMYHTGDLVRWSGDGELLFMGRIDTQVKLRGFRIELGEIESRLASFPDVKAAVAKVVEIGGVQHLCAYFTASSDIDTTALKAHLSAALTSYMVPDALMQMDAFPLTPNGKVDLKKLPLPELGKTAANAFEEPVGEVENAIARAFAEVLATAAPVGRNDSFFNLGGTSLLVMKLIVALSDKGWELTYSDVFKYQSPCAMAAFIEGLEAGSSKAGAPAAGIEQTVSPDQSATGDDGYDYSAINTLLESNSVQNIGKLDELDCREIGDVLLLGSTGYLGIHVLEKLLSKGSSKVWCVIRPKKGVSCEGRLKSYLMYYFDRTWSELLGKRLFVMEGDMTDEGVMDRLLGIKVDTVINCAANVKHFAAGDQIEKINLNGAERLIEYCLKTGSRLVHTSTHSISGQMEGAQGHTMLESELYFGQKLMTKYQTSKFAAERAILQACADKGLKAKIMRLGNLMPRFSDGEFQINIENNGFMARMRAYYLIGCIPAGHLQSALEFAPIDETADAILTLARTPDRFTVFHPFNNHTIYIDDVVAVMRKCGLGIKVTDSATFNDRLQACLKDDRLNPYITSLLAYGSHSNYTANPPSLDFTVSVLNAMDWRWPITGIRYLSDAFEKIIALEYFEK